MHLSIDKKDKDYIYNNGTRIYNFTPHADGWCRAACKLSLVNRIKMLFGWSMLIEFKIENGGAKVKVGKVIK